MIKIKELTDMIDVAQWTVIDQNLYYDKVQETIVFINDYSEVDESDIFNDDRLLITVEPFARDMFHDFFETINNPNVRDMLKERFHGSKKYRKVKDLFPRYHLLDAFHRFKDMYQLNIAKTWCIENKVNYIDLDGKVIIVDKERLE